MLNQNFARGLLLAVIALAFGLGSLRYQIGDLARAGPGLFPLLVSSLLLAIAVLSIVQSRFLSAAPLQLDVKNIGLVLLGLGAFVAATLLVSIVVGILALVFISTLAGTSYSWRRNLMVSAGLVVVAYMFQAILGLNLGLPFV